MRIILVTLMSFALLSCKSLIADPEPLDSSLQATSLRSYYIEKSISTGIVRNSAGDVDPSLELAAWLFEAKAGIDERLVILSDANLDQETKDKLAGIWSEFNNSKVHFIAKSDAQYRVTARLYRYSLKIDDCQNRKGQYRLGCATEINRQLSRYNLNPVQGNTDITSPAIYEQVPVARDVQFIKSPWISEREDRE
ncbi:hypothetical protein GUA87_10545 [Sneathiella sp. P13V-1]|uniref:hypothetical protein n=1 Tax=Sneathiella sp. P13V-1 TaxID=2697366 RepID=UPI00187B247D|nr:hypothetical protein [Sneathiella sp. P13V-1]MBE7637284.1 hypothetical protein [Sneathiella sp. P13V-1]